MVVLGDSKREGVDLSLPVPDLSFYSDASDVDWGAIVGEHKVSGVLDSKPKGILYQPQGDDGGAERTHRVQLSPQRQDDHSLLRQSLISGDWEAQGLRSCSSKRGRFSSG